MAKKRRRRGIPLPWEQRAAFMRAIFTGARWKAVVAGLVLLLGVGLIYRAAGHETRMRQTRAAIAELHHAIGVFRSELGRCPGSMDELLRPPQPASLQLRAVPEDGWGNALHMECPSVHDSDAADVVSSGPSGSFFVDDNVR